MDEKANRRTTMIILDFFMGLFGYTRVTKDVVMLIIGVRQKMLRAEVEDALRGLQTLEAWARSCRALNKKG